MSFSLIGLAVAPGIAIALYVYFRDKYEKEPLKLLAVIFFLGFFSVLPAAWIEIWCEETFLLPQTLAGLAVSNFIFVALVEEGFKFFLVWLYVFNKPDFNEPFDGITYAVMVSMGFATAENILYVIDGGMQTAILRIFTAVPAHASFGVLMGYFMGLAKFSPPNALPYLLLSILAATIFHGAYDFFLTIKSIELIALGALVSLLVSLWLSFKAMKNLNENSPFRYAIILGKSTRENIKEEQ